MHLLPARLPRAALKALVSGAAALVSLLASPLIGAQPSVPYVPTPQVVVDRMLEIAHVGPHDYLIDLGSGDGRIVVTAAQKYGIRALGVDLNPARISEAEVNARKAGVAEKVQFRQQDLFQTDLTPATVITMYLLPNVNLQLRPKLLQLRPGTRIVSHDFSMGDWKPEVHEQIEAKDKYGGSGGRSDIYLWIVPARVAGTWTSELQVRGKPVAYEITLGQEFQDVSGAARVAGQNVRLDNVKLSATALSFEFTAQVDGMSLRHAFSGDVIGNTIDGIVDLSGPTLQARSVWSATRAAPPAAASGAGLSGAPYAALQ